MAAASHEADAGCGTGTDHEADGVCPSDVGCPLLAVIPPLTIPLPFVAMTTVDTDASGLNDHGTSPQSRPPKLSI
jgi:hypothetical protein